MIKIEKVKKVGSTKYVTLEYLSSEYLRRSKKYTSPYKILKLISEEENITVNGKDYSFADFLPIQVDYLNELYEDYNSIIIGKPTELEEIINKKDESIIGIEENTPFGRKFKLNGFGRIILEIFGYERYFRGIEYKAMWWAKELNLRTCPYCNSQYTLIVNKNSKYSQAKFQFDHFFPKKRFPYLSISMYNLIPSCANCNLAKGDNFLSLINYYNPYHSCLHEKGGFYIPYDIDIEKLSIGDTNNIDLPILFNHTTHEHEDFVKNHDKLYNISGIYERMEDEARKLLNVAIVNNKTNRLMTRGIKGLFPDEKTHLEYILGNHPYKNQIIEKPMAKFTQDIAKQLKLIK